MKLNQEELAAVLAGLRLLQSTEDLPGPIADIYYDSGEIQGMSDDDVDRLCERLNVDDSSGESDTIDAHVGSYRWGDPAVAQAAIDAAYAGKLSRRGMGALVTALVNLFGAYANRLNETIGPNAHMCNEWCMLARSALADAADAGEQYQAVDESTFIDHIRQRIEDQDLDLDDIPVRMFRYGRMDPCTFDAEMRERIEMQQQET